MKFQANLKEAVEGSISDLLTYGAEIDTGHWQGVSTEGKPDLVTKELMGVSWACQMPYDVETLAMEVKPNLPWAEDHFQERVGREPTNPGEQYLKWPWWRGQDFAAMVGTEGNLKFTHTYQERFWPKHTGNTYEDGEGSFSNVNRGIRCEYGDLDDVVALLRREPHTRQATFPIFFPEDTGAVHGGRIPCTLHYHFLLRDSKLHMWYAIRSCDAVRHFRDDVYMAVRLCQWVIGECLMRGAAEEEQGKYDPWLEPVVPGYLHFTAYSFHVHKGDLHLL